MLISDWSSDVCSSDLGVLPLLLLVVSGLGSERKGSQAWFALGPFQLQPSELAKVVVIVALASLIAHFNSELDAARLAGALALVGVPMAPPRLSRRRAATRKCSVRPLLDRKSTRLNSSH